MNLPPRPPPGGTHSLILHGNSSFITWRSGLQPMVYEGVGQPAEILSIITFSKSLRDIRERIGYNENLLLM